MSIKEVLEREYNVTGIPMISESGVLQKQLAPKKWMTGYEIASQINEQQTRLEKYPKNLEDSNAELLNLLVSGDIDSKK